VPARLVRLAILVALLAAAAPAAADRYVAGSPGGGDPFFPNAGNGGYDVKHYSLELDYEQPRSCGRGTASTATAT
jgi:hypothetical protein